MITKESIKEFVENNPKLVSRKQLKSYPELYILKYKKNVFWDNLWNEFLIESRGTVIDEDYNVVSRPFTKIFNLHENNTRIDRDEVVEAYRKINGFMAAITLYKGELLITTTGTDDSEFAQLAREMIEKHCYLNLIKIYLAMAINKIIPFYPIYARAPNKLLRYEERRFVCQAGHPGIERVAIFQDSKKNIQEMTAQVIWK